MTRTIGLTEKQEKVLIVIQEYIKTYKMSPTIRELCDLVGIKSTSTMWGYIKRLQKRGYIDMINFSPRSIKIEKNGIEINKKELWEKQSNLYNSIFDYLKSKGLNENELINFSQLLSEYIQFI